MLIGIREQICGRGVFEISFEEKIGFCQLHMEAVETRDKTR